MYVITVGALYSNLHRKCSLKTGQIIKKDALVVCLFLKAQLLYQQDIFYRQVSEQAYRRSLVIVNDREKPPINI